MTTKFRVLFIALLALSLAACNDDAGAPADAAAPTANAPLTAPANDEDDAAWGEYLTDVVRRNMGGVSNSPYLYYLPSESTENFEGEYDRLLEKAELDISRGILAGNMLAFGSPASSRMADLIIESFNQVDPGAMEGVRVLFIGDASDNQRVQESLKSSGVSYQFVEAR